MLIIYIEKLVTVENDKIEKVIEYFGEKFRAQETFIMQRNLFSSSL